ncbi:sushi, von Willebrand factor type A, EGF and pentraxin domain-containing protein 1 [Nephila pilipes]|uniref:Sushi, von Willebrand factor type A, EGF and pentraxin domain-containing protein 1 n=1 Tax=Nephila pilipes TaxID=299642 RepID=A0A8X6QCK9_NEPPI|nr:sushi, von Willebrand factor type A, EGF and pentraxin domain-containing protein 1 [Nephila pilipes]
MFSFRPCFKKLPGENCTLRCATRYFIVGKNYITCLNDSTWSILPNCTPNICKRPELPPFLKIDEICFLRFQRIGQNCSIFCREGGNLIGVNKVTCVTNKDWRLQADCTCAAPVLSEELATRNDCNNTKRGEYCKLFCKPNKNRERNISILCQNNTKWSTLPKCNENLCPNPILPKRLVFEEDCLFKTVEESCKVRCKHGLIIGEPTIKCTEELRWSTFPNCSCPESSLNGHDTEDCTKKRETCRNKGDRRSDSKVTCDNNTKRNVESKYILKNCPKPVLPDILQLEENCSWKYTKEKCHVKCKENRRMVGNGYIICDFDGKWVSFPNCTCPLLKLENNLKYKGECGFKRPKQKCFIECEKELKLTGPNYIICQRNSKWSSQPKCVKELCPTPVLRSGTLVLKEICSGKTVGDTCRVGCTNGGNIIGKNKIKCSRNFQWNEPPNCSCPVPIVEKSIELLQNCTLKEENEKCFLQCKKGYKTKGRNYAVCQNNGKWNSFPKCIKTLCPNPVIRGSPLKFQENCSEKYFKESCSLSCKEGGHIISKNIFHCQSNSQWSTLPKCTCSHPRHTKNLKLKHDCSFIKPGRKCLVECIKGFQLIGSDFLLCQNNTKWSSLPKCVHMICASPNLPDYLEIQQTCLAKKVGESCEITCKHGGKIIGTSEIKCLAGNSWSSFPDCSCPTPKSWQKRIQFKENCSFKKRNQKCAVVCPEGYSTENESFITCLNNGTWSSLPVCLRTHCSRPVLDGQILKQDEICSKKRIGETCRVRCAHGGHLIGLNVIKCQKQSNWSPYPSCTCPDLTISSDLKTQQDCNYMKRGEKCFLECKIDLKLHGLNYILCQNNSKWSSQPKCIKYLCPAPVLHGGILVLKENCSTKTSGNTCAVTCKNGGNVIGDNKLLCSANFQWSSQPQCACETPNVSKVMELKGNCSFLLKNEKCFIVCMNGFKSIGRNYTICQDNGKLGVFPFCQKESCPEPVMRSSTLKLEGKCSEKFFDDICVLRCREGGQLFGGTGIKCESTGQWSTFPYCTCPTPNLSKGLMFKNNCSFKKPQEKCFVECAKNLQLVGNLLVLCQNNTKWSSMPKCVHMKCPSPNLPEYLDIQQNCLAKTVGDSCEITCKHGGKIIGTSEIKCLAGSSWSSFPDCSCPTPKSRQKHIQFKENCSFKKRNQKCTVVCPEGYSTKNESFITCLNNATWSSLPVCLKTYCSRPLLNGQILKEDENCVRKKIGETCRVRCVQGGHLIGLNVIKCYKQGDWSPSPSCTCPDLTMSSDLKAEKNCNYTKRGGKCFVECKIDLKLHGLNYILCQKNSKWSSQPICVATLCPAPVLPDDLLVLKENCSGKNVGGTCFISCKNGRNVIGNNEIKCLVNLTWSTPPDCSCRFPEIAGSVELKEKCSFKQRSEKCFIDCKIGYRLVGPKYTTCQSNTQWSVLPTCVKISCQSPVLPSIFQTIEMCNGKFFNDVCHVICSKGGKLIGENFIKCLSTMQWSPFPICSCPSPNLFVYLKTTHNCGSIIPGEKCFLECDNDFKLIGNDFMLCQNDTTWSAMPKCSKIYCPQPVLLAGVLKLEENCVSKSIGETCQVECKEKGHLIGGSFVTCLKSHYWNSFPDCTCSSPILTSDLRTNHLCNFIQRNEKCFLRCEDDSFELIGNNFITCQNDTKWTPLPSCVTSFCPMPVLPEYLIFAGDCRSKAPQANCYLICRNGGNLLPYDHITCSTEKKWSAFSDCSCPIPNISDKFQFLEDCSRKMSGNICPLRCKFASQSDIILLTCQENRKWSSLPKCVPRICNVPLLPVYLNFFENCESKTVGGNCILRCREGGFTINSKYITCIEENKWSEFMECTCPSPVLNEKLTLHRACNEKRRGEQCSLFCNDFPVSSLNDFSITCQDNTKWSVLPACKQLFCPAPALPNFLEVTSTCPLKAIGEKCLLTCREKGTMIGNNIITCLEGSTWSQFPDCKCSSPVLSDDLELAVNTCEGKMRREHCSVRCSNQPRGPENIFLITCQDNTKWGVLPECKTMICPPPILPQTLRFEEDCTSKRKGANCLLKCRETGEIIGINYVTCLEESTWSKFPACDCPLPVLDEDKILHEDCSHKMPGEECFLGCRNHLYGINNNFHINCQNNTKWSVLPACRKTVCHAPTLPETLTFEENCSWKKLGETCLLNCREGGKSISDNYITCSEEGIWSEFPVCACPLPILGEDVIFYENCNKKMPGEKCLLGIRNHISRVINNFSITCQDNTKWSVLPTCRNAFCPDPTLPKTLIFGEDCSLKKTGESCMLRCREGGKSISDNYITCSEKGIWSEFPICACPHLVLGEDMIFNENCNKKNPGEQCLLGCRSHLLGIDYNFPITCQDNAKWSVLPACKNTLCTTPILPKTLLFEEDCSLKKVRENCLLNCREGGENIGVNYIICLGKSSWSHFPACACPLPVLGEDMILNEDCSHKMPSEQCLVGCGKQLLGIDYNFPITCQDNTKWSVLPACKNTLCTPPTLPKTLIFEEDCSWKKMGENCLLYCREGGKSISGYYITCSEEGIWSEFPVCACPLPILGEGMIFNEDCSQKMPGEQCSLGCKNQFAGKESNIPIACQDNTKWGSLFSCDSVFCSTPVLPETLEFEEDCTSKKIGDHCPLSCRERGSMFGTNYVICSEGNTWSHFPDCACSTPIVPQNTYIFNEDCSQKRRGEMCKLSCLLHIFRKDHVIQITCQDNTKWSELPVCDELFCPTLISSRIIKIDTRTCRSKMVGEVCPVTCRLGGTLLGRNILTCLEGSKWSDPPECSCPAPTINSELALSEDCSQKMHHDACWMICVATGMRVNIVCQENTMWSSLPICKTMPQIRNSYCETPSLPEILIFTENCSFKTRGETCELACREGGIMFPKRKLICKGGNTWSEFPDCFCNDPSTSDHYTKVNSCSSVHRGGHCLLVCNKVSMVAGQRFAFNITCQDNTKWTSPPICPQYYANYTLN